MFRGIEHVAIAAQDSQALAQWYIELFGFQIAYSSGAVYMLKASNGAMLEIVPAESGVAEQYAVKQVGLRHLALTVPDFSVASEYLQKKGICFFEIRDLGDSKLAFFHYPEGNILHLMWREKPIS